MFFNIFQKLFSKHIHFVFPPTKAEIKTNVPLSKKTWMGVGGNAEFYFEPQDEKDLCNFIKNKPEIPILILGGGSNVIVRDGGVPGVTIHLGKSFANISIDGDHIICGAGLLSMDLSRFAQKNGLSGFEFLCGIPGTVGGALQIGRASCRERV